jgi:hypothetical protein
VHWKKEYVETQAQIDDLVPQNVPYDAGGPRFKSPLFGQLVKASAKLHWWTDKVRKRELDMRHGAEGKPKSRQRIRFPMRNGSSCFDQVCRQRELCETRGAAKKKETKVTYISCSTKKKVVTYSILFLFLFFIFSSNCLTRFLGVS